MTAGAGQITASLTLDISKFKKSLAEAQTAVQGMQKTASQAVSAGGGGGAAAKSANKLSEALQVQKTVLQTLSGDFKKLRDNQVQGLQTQDQYRQSMQGVIASANQLKKSVSDDVQAYNKFNSVAAAATKEIRKIDAAEAKAAATAQAASDKQSAAAQKTLAAVRTKSSGIIKETNKIAAAAQKEAQAVATAAEKQAAADRKALAAVKAKADSVVKEANKVAAAAQKAAAVAAAASAKQEAAAQKAAAAAVVTAEKHKIASEKIAQAATRKANAERAASAAFTKGQAKIRDDASAAEAASRQAAALERQAVAAAKTASALEGLSIKLKKVKNDQELLKHSAGTQELRSSYNEVRSSAESMAASHTGASAAVEKFRSVAAMASREMEKIDVAQARAASSAQKSGGILSRLTGQHKNLVSALKNGEISQDQFADGMRRVKEQANQLKSGLDQASPSYVRLGQVTSSATVQINKVAEAQRRAQAAATREADVIVAESERKARAQEKAAQRAVDAINKSIKASTKFIIRSKGGKQIDPNVATMAIAQKNVAALNKEIGRGAITYTQAAQNLDMLEKEITQAGSGAQRGTEAFRQFQTAMTASGGTKTFISNQQAAGAAAQQTAAALKGSTSKMGGLFKVMGAGMASSSRSMVMSVTNISEAFQKGQMGGRMLSTFLLGDLMDAMMIGSFATDGLVKSANALPPAMAAAKASMLSVAKFFPIAMVGASLLAAGLGMLVKHFSDSGKSAKEAKDEIASLDKQIRETSTAINIIMGHFSGLDKVFDGLDKSVKGVADAIRVLGERFSDIKSSSSHLDDLEAKMQALKKATPGGKILAAATADTEKMAKAAQDAKENFQGQTTELTEQTKRLEEMRQKLYDMRRSQGKKGSALEAFFLDRRVTAATAAIEEQIGAVTGASNVYTAAKGAAEEYAASLDEIRKKAAELDKAQKKADGDKRREKAVQGLIEKYNRLKPLFEATAASPFEKDVKQAQKFAAEMAKIIKTLKKFSGVKAAKDFLQAKEDNELLKEIDKNTESLKRFTEWAEEAKQRARNLLKEAGGETTLKMGIGMTAQVSGPDAMMAKAMGGLSPSPFQSDSKKIGVMTPEQKLRQRLKVKDPEQEALLAKVRSFKKSLTDLGLSSSLATKALNAIPLTILDVIGAMAQFADEFAAGVGNMAMGNFGDTFKLAGKGAGMAAGAALGVDPETAGKVGEALGAFSDMMVGKIDVTSAAGNQYNMGEVIQAAFDQPIKAVADAFMPLADAAHLLASNFGGFLAQMITTFKPLISLVGNIFNIAFQLVANTLGSLMPAFVAIAVVVNPLAKMISSFLDVLMPVINVSLSLSMALAGILLPIMALVSPLGQLVLIAPLLTAVFFEVGKVLQEVATDIGKAFQWMFRGLAQALYGIEDMLIDMFGGEETFLSQAMRTLGNNMYDLGDNMANAANGTGAFGNGMDETLAGLDAANAARDKANKAASKVLNAPQGFKVEKYRYEAMSPEQSNPFTGSSLDGGGGGTVINIENIFVEDGDDLFERLENEANQVGGRNPSFG